MFSYRISIALTDRIIAGLEIENLYTIKKGLYQSYINLPNLLRNRILSTKVHLFLQCFFKDSLSQILMTASLASNTVRLLFGPICLRALVCYSE